jgi:hypothetical protein
MNTTTVPAAISLFAQQVRAELADLSADDLEDLTDGLEADLAESLAENPGRSLSDPVAYALELRTAAGLPLHQEPGRGVRGAVRGMASGLRATAQQMGESLRGNPVTAGALDFAVSLRPFWWVLRAWVAYQLLAVFTPPTRALPHNLGAWIVLAVLIVISVQWGRDRWRRWGWLAGLVVVGNVVAAILVVPFLASTSSTAEPETTTLMVAQAKDKGVTLDGKPVSNIFAYGADGKALKDVQLFDQSGHPLTPFVDPTYPDCMATLCDEGGGLVPQAATLETGETVKNVYPLALLRMVYNENGDIVPAAPRDQKEPKAPFIQVPKVVKEPDQAEKVE